MSTIRAPWDSWPVHGLCKSGHHDMCKAYEDQNFRANHVCGCESCDHPKPTRQEYEQHELRIYGHVRFQEKQPDQLDSPASTDVASWFVTEDDNPEDDGHTEAREENENMSETETMAPPVVHDEPVHEEPEVEAEVTEEGDGTESEDSNESVNSADSVDEGDADDTEDAEEVPTRARGELEEEVKEITDLYVNGKLKLPDDKELTPHYIAKAIEKKFDYPEPPSTGAVAAVLKRWQDYGYAEFGEDPFHFVGLTDEGQSRGLATLREETKEARKEARRKEREAKKAALAAEEATEDNSTATTDEGDSDEE